MMARTAEILSFRRGCLLFIGGYFVILCVIRIVMFPGSSEDDAEQLFFSQVLAWGYKANQPPLYTWLVILAQQIFGVSAASVAVVKFSSLFVLYYFTYRAAACVFADSQYASLSALSLLAIFYINWDAVVNYSHTVLMAAFLAATLYTVLKIDPKKGIGSYILLGILMGLGLLSKYNFALFLIPLLIAVFLTKSFRGKIFTPKIVLSVIIAAAIMTPHGLWLLANPESIKATPEYIDVAGDVTSGAGSAAWHIGKGLFGAASGAIMFLAPLWILYLLFFWRSFKPLNDSDQKNSEARRFFEIYFLAFAVIAISGIVALSLSGIRTHWMMVLLPFPIYFLLRIQATSPSKASLNRFTVLLAILPFIVTIALMSRALTAPNFCKKCNFFIPYAELSQHIKKAGFKNGTIVTHGLPNQLGGNFRRYFPDARVISRRYVYFVPKEKPQKTKGKCLLVWNESPRAHRGSRAWV